jgi:peptidoglycan-associated lipoprotein
MKTYKIVAFAFLIIALASCGNKTKKNKADPSNQANESNLDYANQANESNLDVNQDPQNFDAIDSKDNANESNAISQAQIEEVEVADRILFDLNSTSISHDAKKILDNQIAWLKSDYSINITIEGHCDERGAREYNLALGEKRANIAKQYLVLGGIDSSRIKTISYGKERPDFVGFGEEVWSKNRRATTVVNQ